MHLYIVMAVCSITHKTEDEPT